MLVAGAAQQTLGSADTAHAGCEEPVSHAEGSESQTGAHVLDFQKQL